VITASKNDYGSRIKIKRRDQEKRSREEIKRRDQEKRSREEIKRRDQESFLFAQRLPFIWTDRNLKT
jgi:hypothetical protein